MTHAVVSADVSDTLRHVGGVMREREVGAGGGSVEMDLEEAADLMVQHHIRRLPLLDGDDLAGIVTIDDVAVRAGDLALAQRVTAEVAKGAIPEFFFHRRGGRWGRPRP